MEVKKFEILSGLPGSGDSPIQFSATGMGTHSEGFVVRFITARNAVPWIGNFQRDLSRLDTVVEHPDATDLIVIAGGDVYIVDVESRSLKETFGGTFETLISVP